MNKKNIPSICFTLVLLSCISLFPSLSRAVTLTKDTVWQGEVKLGEDVLVPKGVTLTIKPGTSIKVAAAESTKTDPEYMSPLTEITIRGTLRAEGTVKEPIEFSGVENRAGSWAGVVIDQGMAQLSFFRIKHADTAVHILDGQARINGGTLQDNRYGIVLQGNRTDVLLEHSEISGNDYGLFNLQNARLATKAVTVSGNRKKDSFNAVAKVYDPGIKSAEPAELPVGRRYGDTVFRGDTIWQGRIEVAGIIRVPQGSRLIILPGSVIEYLKRDTDGDGIGENGLLIQGRLIAKGTKSQPIVFRSAESNKQMGDWDSINIMDSAGAQNLIEYCRIEHAYRGLHFHFSNVAVHNSIIENNYRGIQFQESQVDMKGNYLAGNKSGVQGRDSDLAFAGNVLYNNYAGANFFRSTIHASANRIVGNWKEGIRIRDGVSMLHENLVDGNRNGIMLADMYYGGYSRNVVSNNVETGMSLKNADNIEVSGNFIAANGINGLNVQESRVLIKGNLISDNGERGIGVLSFDGVITENNLASNGLYAIDLDGVQDVNAPDNWWGGSDPARAVFDGRSEPSRGKVLYNKPSAASFPFEWPSDVIPTNTIWRGTIVANKSITVSQGAVLSVAPKTTVELARNTGLLVKGRMIANGKPAEKIIFTSREKKGASEWDEIQFEFASGSAVSNCVFEYATWGIHSHFTDLAVSDSRFSNNYGGIRFRSGPVVVKRSRFENNTIGIRSYIGNAVITENVITENEIGVFVREKGGGLAISGNNIFRNHNYNLRIGDFNDEDVPAKGNWWGSDDPLPTFFDGRNEPGIGKVLFEPFLKTPAKLDSGVRP